MKLTSVKNRAVDIFVPLVFLCVVIFSELVFYHLTKSDFFATLVRIVLFLIASLIAHFLLKDNNTFEKKCTFRIILKLMGLFLVVLFVSQQVFDWYFINFSHVSFWVVGSYGNYLLFLVLGPILEEFFFRGVIYRSHERALGPVFACFSSSILFALYHGNLVELTTVFLFGFFLSIVYYYTRSLKICIAFHIVANVLYVLLSFTQIQNHIPEFFLLTPIVIIMYLDSIIALCTFLIVDVSRKRQAESKEIQSH